eukprot:PhM_4_TR8759/c0_g1_i1/m.5157
MRASSFLLLGLFFVAIATGLVAAVDVTTDIIIPIGDKKTPVTVNVMYDTTSHLATFVVSVDAASAPTWLGVGFPKPNSTQMVGADLVIGIFSKKCVRPLYFNNDKKFDTPRIHPTNASVAVVGTSYKLTFTRAVASASEGNIVNMFNTTSLIVAMRTDADAPPCEGGDMMKYGHQLSGSDEVVLFPVVDVGSSVETVLTKDNVSIALKYKALTRQTMSAGKATAIGPLKMTFNATLSGPAAGVSWFAMGFANTTEMVMDGADMFMAIYTPKMCFRSLLGKKGAAPVENNAFVFTSPSQLVVDNDRSFQFTRVVDTGLVKVDPKGVVPLIFAWSHSKTTPCEGPLSMDNGHEGSLTALVQLNPSAPSKSSKDTKKRDIAIGLSVSFGFIIIIAVVLFLKRRSSRPQPDEFGLLDGSKA